MRLLLGSLLLVSACAGPGRNALANTPTATTKRTPAEAPAASGSDEDREQLIQSNDDMTDAKNAHKEAGEAPAPPAPKPAPGSVQPTTKPAAPDTK